MHFPVPDSKHFPVMVAECLEFLGLSPAECREGVRDGIFLDATAGLGGHTAAIAARLQELAGRGWVLACDRDAESLAIAKTNMARANTEEAATQILSAHDAGAVRSQILPAHDAGAVRSQILPAHDAGAVRSRIRFRQALFSQMEETLAAEGIITKNAHDGLTPVRSQTKNAHDGLTPVRSQLDGLLADLGVSRYQLTGGERGFSLMADGPLDMRMSRGEGQTAADLVNYESEGNLANLIYGLGEERRSRKIARAIVRARPINTTLQLARLIEGVAPRTGKIHPATQTFMALRMAVNRELEELDALLDLIPRVVKPGGRAVILTFMSIEDRKVKQSFQAMAKAGRVRLLNRHVVRPTEEEIRENPPSRSAKLRALEIL